jgi:hypothetical protein
MARYDTNFHVGKQHYSRNIPLLGEPARRRAKAVLISVACRGQRTISVIPHRSEVRQRRRDAPLTFFSHILRGGSHAGTSRAVVNDYTSNCEVTFVLHE